MEYKIFGDKMSWGDGEDYDDDIELETNNTMHRNENSKWIKKVKNKTNIIFDNNWGEEGKKIL